ncbi:MAG: DUF2267 domain-containing protein [Chitinophagaceae bacterium]|nr:DUF2267 domain-containing protein [Chitinophagaceae bacterium]
MSKNLITLVQESLNLVPLEKLDPNRQAVDVGRNKLVQAALPTVLAGMYKATRTEEDARQMMLDTNNCWLNRIFGVQAEAIVDRVAHYAHTDKTTTAELMETVADATYSLLQSSTEDGHNASGLKDAFSRERHEILVYLPPQLDMGHLLHDPTIDDRTNKMEGPVSNMMHKIENNFSGGGE